MIHVKERAARGATALSIRPAAPKPGGDFNGVPPMRTNLPVTQREYAFPEGRTLVSVTDLTGRIGHCNAAFVEVSGYTAEELSGQPHNIVRHPDMPAEAFRDMWATIRGGAPWTAVVKNRRKNGDHYWVCANVTPMRNGDEVTGYLSVRTQPTRAAIDGAQALYATMRAEAERGRPVHVLQSGRLVRRDAIGRVRRWLSVGQGAALTALLSAFGGLTAGMGVGVARYSWPVPATLCFGLVLAALAARICRQWLLAPLRAVVVDANRLAGGDLAHPVAIGASGAIGDLQRALMQMSVNLRTVVLDTMTGIAGVRTSADEIAAGNQDLSARTESQAANLQQTAASMEQINGTVRQSAASALEGARMAQDTAAVARRSHAAVSDVVRAMASIAASSHEIEAIVAAVEGVAFQTNILALNAAVEAARAGDAGRSFAVVASEVRALAGRTSDAVRDIRAVIAQSAARVEQGSTHSQDARTRMDEALTSVTRVDAVLGEINNASQQQELGVAQVNEAVAQMDSLTQSNAAMVEQLAASAKSLQSQVDAVDRSMKIFRLGAS
ncbi:MAG: methyl-accepting chemotaxis protein [Betaproteobacteria bacterium]